MHNKRSFRKVFLVESLTTRILSASKHTLFEQNCQNIMGNFKFVNLTLIAESRNGRAAIYSVLKSLKKCEPKSSLPVPIQKTVPTTAQRPQC